MGRDLLSAHLLFLPRFSSRPADLHHFFPVDSSRFSASRFPIPRIAIRFASCRLLGLDFPDSQL